MDTKQDPGTRSFSFSQVFQEALLALPRLKSAPGSIEFVLKVSLNACLEGVPGVVATRSALNEQPDIDAKSFGLSECRCCSGGRARNS
ncbi:hypothetical protein [Hydrogenophaga borbori]|uniref:hypothetical protein n=1 Tax=Hydrogenophaga borbori TaxID=2294117 RepID=UPI00301D87B8